MICQDTLLTTEINLSGVLKSAAALLAFIGVLTGLAILSVQSDSRSTAPTGIDEPTAMVRAKMAISDDLTDPASASYPWLDSPKRMPDGSYKIDSYVDAKNGFGGTVRHKYSVTVGKDGSIISKKIGD